MSNCTNCGSPINEEASFCPSCGLQIAKTGTIPEPLVQVASAQQVSCIPTMANAFSSKLFLYWCIAYTGSIALNSIASIQSALTTAYYTSTASTIGSVIGLLLSQIIPVFLAIALWKCRADGISAQTSGVMNPRGILLYRKIYKITLILTCVLGGMLVVSCFIMLMVFNNNTIYSSTFDPIISILLSFAWVFVSILICVLIVNIIFSFKIMKTFNAIAASAQTGAPTTYISQFAIVLNYISFGLIAFSLFFILFSLFSGNFDILFFISSAVTASSTFFSARWLSSYKKAMQALLSTPQIG